MAGRYYLISYSNFHGLFQLFKINIIYAINAKSEIVDVTPSTERRVRLIFEYYYKIWSLIYVLTNNPTSK